MRTVSVSEARANLAALLQCVADGEQVSITNRGRTVAVLVDPAVAPEEEPNEAVRDIPTAEEIREMLRKAREERRPIRPVMSAERADELVAALRADRDARR